jgi:transporter family protein
MNVSPQTLGIVVGGVVPAVGYSVFAIGTKLAAQSGLGAGPLLVLTGFACAVTGAGFWWLLPAPIDMRSGSWGLMAGFAWAVGTGFVSFALLKWGVPISKLNPIYNTNTLLTVLLGLVIFSEWKQANPLPLVGGALLILVGSLLVSAS